MEDPSGSRTNHFLNKEVKESFMGEEMLVLTTILVSSVAFSLYFQKVFSRRK
jgi:hypothetical protein